MLQNQLGKGSSPFSLSFIPEEALEVSFSADELESGIKDWELALVGHALGRQPFYGALLAAVQKQWKLASNLELLTLEGDFFLFKFSCREDYDMVWNSGPCFLNGKPFLFKKWSWDFRPVREDFAEIPLWVKFPNFPLCCWNEFGLSRVASKIGVPLAADHLTTTKSRLTFARVCVQVSPSSALPDSIPIILNGQRFDQEVQYDWKPRACTRCNTFAHDLFSYPHAAPVHDMHNRGRSRGRNRNMQRDRSFTRPHTSRIPVHIEVSQNLEPSNQGLPIVPTVPNQGLPIVPTIPTPPPPPPPLSHSPPILNSPQIQSSPLTTNISTTLQLTPTSVQLAAASNAHCSSGRQPSVSRERRPSPGPILTDLNSPPPPSPSLQLDREDTEVDLPPVVTDPPSSLVVEDSQQSSPVGKAPKQNPKASNPTKGRRKK